MSVVSAAAMEAIRARDAADEAARAAEMPDAIDVVLEQPRPDYRPRGNGDFSSIAGYNRALAAGFFSNIPDLSFDLDPPRPPTRSEIHAQLAEADAWRLTRKAQR